MGSIGVSLRVASGNQVVTPCAGLAAGIVQTDSASYSTNHISTRGDPDKVAIFLFLFFNFLIGLKN